MKRARLPKRLFTRLRQLRTLRSATNVREPTWSTRGARRPSAAATRSSSASVSCVTLVPTTRSSALLSEGGASPARTHSRTTTMCMRRGPWAPSSIVCSMSPVRDGPVMVFTVRGMRSLP